MTDKSLGDQVQSYLEAHLGNMLSLLEQKNNKQLTDIQLLTSLKEEILQLSQQLESQKPEVVQQELPIKIEAEHKPNKSDNKEQETDKKNQTQHEAVKKKPQKEKETQEQKEQKEKEKLLKQQEKQEKKEKEQKLQQEKIAKAQKEKQEQKAKEEQQQKDKLAKLQKEKEEQKAKDELKKKQQQEKQQLAANQQKDKQEEQKTPIKKPSELKGQNKSLSDFNISKKPKQPIKKEGKKDEALNIEETKSQGSVKSEKTQKKNTKKLDLSKSLAADTSKKSGSNRPSTTTNANSKSKNLKEFPINSSKVEVKKPVTTKDQDKNKEKEKEKPLEKSKIGKQSQDKKNNNSKEASLSEKQTLEQVKKQLEEAIEKKQQDNQRIKEEIIQEGDFQQLEIAQQNEKKIDEQTNNEDNQQNQEVITKKLLSEEHLRSVQQFEKMRNIQKDIQTQLEYLEQQERLLWDDGKQELSLMTSTALELIEGEFFTLFKEKFTTEISDEIYHVYVALLCCLEEYGFRYIQDCDKQKKENIASILKFVNEHQDNFYNYLISEEKMGNIDIVSKNELEQFLKMHDYIIQPKYFEQKDALTGVICFYLQDRLKFLGIYQDTQNQSNKDKVRQAMYYHEKYNYYKDLKKEYSC